ncbi:MAG: HPP family protein [Thermoplasma acidophilum]|nr:HPP family protein [Thermoplasma acidophilum]
MNRAEENGHDIDQRIAFACFLVIFAVIVSVTLVFRIALLAPPFAVSAYLITIAHRGKYSKPESILVSYIAVIAITTAFHLAIGIGPISLYLTTLAVSAIITFTRYSHPPAIALAIFSYIVHEDAIFAESSLLIVAILVISDVLIHRTLRPKD